MLKIKELKKMLEEMVQFYVLQLQEIVLLTDLSIKVLITNTFNRHSPEFQFSVSGSRFFVLAQEPENFNSLYRASGSLKMKK